MEVLANFGFEPLLFLAQIINFLILFIIFRKFLYKPILKVLKDREVKIKKGLEDAEEAGKALEEADTRRDKIVAEAGKEAEKILEETRKSAEELRDTILADAKAKSEKIMKEAQDQATLQMTNMEKQAKSVALDLSMALLEKVIGDMFSKDEKEKILKKSVSQLKNIND